jgi:hypothetical protein
VKALPGEFFNAAEKNRLRKAERSQEKADGG